MNRSKRTALAAGVAALVSFAVALPAAAQATWKPDKPITIIVPWAAGGSTDQVTRVTAAEIEKALGQKVVVVNQPGASGSIGTKNAMEAAKDGYTWTAGAAQDLGTYKVLGMLDTTVGDWVLFLNVANVSTLAVNPNTPYKTAAEFIDALKAKPGQVSVVELQLPRGFPYQGTRAWYVTIGVRGGFVPLFASGANDVRYLGVLIKPELVP